MTANDFRNNNKNLLTILSDPHICVSYSQCGEDTLIAEYLIGKNFVSRKKFYVDLGAYHPSRFSNTKLLHLMGWTGMNVDPNPDSIELFKKFRPNDVNLNIGVSSKRETLELYRFAEGALNTFDKERAEKLTQDGWQTKEKISVQSLPVNEILETYLPEEVKESGIGFLDIDCEGLDIEIISTLDFKKFNPLIIAAEAHDFDPMYPLNNEICKIICSQGYYLSAYLKRTLLLFKSNPDL
jgi:hypothetical protein